MKSFFQTFIGASIFFLVLAQPLQAHEGCSHGGARDDAELSQFAQRVLTEIRSLDSAPSSPQAPRLVVYSSGKRLSINSDHFSRAYFLALESYLEVFEREAACKGLELGPRVKKQIWTRAQGYLKDIARFGVELGPTSWEFYQNYGISFAIYFAVTESIEHVLLAPVLFSIPICKLIQGAYAWVAEPMRTFKQGCMANPQWEPSGATLLDRLGARVVRGALAVRTQYRLRQIFREASLVTSQARLEKNIFRKPWLKNIERQDSRPELALHVARSPYWAELASAELPPQDSALEFQSQTPEEDFAILLRANFSRSERLDRVEALGRGLQELQKILGSQWGAIYHSRNKAGGLKGRARDWATLFRVKGLSGKMQKALGRWQTLMLATAARGSSESVSLEWAQDMAFTYREILDVFSTTAELQIRWAKDGFPQDARSELLALEGHIDLVGRAADILARGKLLGGPECAPLLEDAQ